MLAGKHRRNVVITLIIPVLFFGAISLGLDRPQKAKEIPCQGVTSQFTLTEQPVIIPAGTARAIKGLKGYSMTAREGTVATWIASQRLLGVDADFFHDEPTVSDLADSIAGSASTGAWPFDDVGPGALASTATIDGALVIRKSRGALVLAI